MAANKAAARRKPLSAQDEKRFLEAVTAGHIDKVRHFLERGANPAAESSRALSIALRSQFPKIAKLLISRGARVEDVAKAVFSSLNGYRGIRPPEWAIELLTAHFTPATVPSALLFDSLRHISAVQALLRAGADPNVEQQQQFEPLSVLAAAIRNHLPDTAIALIDAGASPHWTLSRTPWRRPFDRNESVLTMACERPVDARVVRRLVAAGANVNPRQGVRPLTRAIETKTLDCAKYLLTQGADPALVDAGHLTLWTKQWEIVPALLRHGDDFQVSLTDYTRCREMPLEILGLLLRAQVRWVLDAMALMNTPQMEHPEVPRDTPEVTIRAMMQAKAALVYPDMQPQKLL